MARACGLHPEIISISLANIGTADRISENMSAYSYMRMSGGGVTILLKED
jgi:hypothetical protein